MAHYTKNVNSDKRQQQGERLLPPLVPLLQTRGPVYCQDQLTWALPPLLLLLLPRARSPGRSAPHLQPFCRLFRQPREHAAGRDLPPLPLSPPLPGATHRLAPGLTHRLDGGGGVDILSRRIGHTSLTIQ